MRDSNDQPACAASGLEVSEEDFVSRFVARLLALAGPVDGEGEPVEPYARATALSYFETDWQRKMGPEECAESDYSYWEVP